MSTQEEEVQRLMRYLRSLDYLNRHEPSAIRSIITMVNRFVMDPTSKKKVMRHQDLAEKMLDYGVYNKVMEFAEGLIQDPSTCQTFMDAFREGNGNVREALVKDYMQPVPKGTTSHSKSTLDDLIRFFKNASPEIRYFMILDDTTKALAGIVSVNDFTRHLDEIRATEKGTLVVDLPFFNSTPKIILNTDKMEYAYSLFNEAQVAGRKITKLLVVDNSKRPVGFIAEPDIVRWEAGTI